MNVQYSFPRESWALSTVAHSLADFFRTVTSYLLATSLSLLISHTFPSDTKMAAASSIQPLTIHSSVARESAVLPPEMDSPVSRRQEDEEAAGQPSETGVSLRELPELEPEEVERRLAKTRQELSNRRKILIKNLPPDTTNQVPFTDGSVTSWLGLEK